MKNLERAVRVYRALCESPVRVDSVSVNAWSHVERVIAHNAQLLQEMRELPTAARSRVMAYVGEFTPLNEGSIVYQLPGPRQASAFVSRVTEDGSQATHIDGAGLVSALGFDSRAQESIDHVAAEFGGTRVDGPKLADRFERVDVSLPEAMMASGLDPQLCEDSLIAAVYGRGADGKLNESLFLGIHGEGQFGRFRTRLSSFAIPKPVLGVDAHLAEAVRRSGLATPEMLDIMEAGGGAAVGVSPGGAAQGADTGRGGIAKDQPDTRHGSPADRQTTPQEVNPQPTEHVPTQEQGAQTNAITLPDGTEIPMDVMRQAFAKMLQSMATQVANGTEGGQPTQRGEPEREMTGTEPPQPSVQQQQMAQQTASQQAVGQEEQPANGEEAPPVETPSEEPVNGEAPPANGEAPAEQPANGEQPPAEAPAEAPAAEAPAEAPAQDIDGLLAAAEGGDAEALKQAQGKQGEMTPEQQQKLQAILAQQIEQQQAAGQPATAAVQPAQESLSASYVSLINELHEAKGATRARANEALVPVSPAARKKHGMKPIKKRGIQAVSRTAKDIERRKGKHEGVMESLRDALKLLNSESTRDVLSGIDMVVETGFADQPTKLVERVIDTLDYLAGHDVSAIKKAARNALASDLYTETVDENIFMVHSMMQASKAGKGKVKAKGGKAKTGGGYAGMSIQQAMARERELAGTASGAGSVRHGAEKLFKAAKDLFTSKKGQKESYQRVADNGGVQVYRPVVSERAGVLPEGVDYGTSEADAGTIVAILETQDETSLVRLPCGDVVRIGNEFVREAVSESFVDGKIMETADIEQIIENASGVVVVVGPLSSGKSCFIKNHLGPALREGRFPRAGRLSTEMSNAHQALRHMQASVAREDYAKLVGALSEGEFEEALGSPQFRYTAEGRSIMLRSFITESSFSRHAARGFDRFFGDAKVRRYYAGMRSSLSEMGEDVAAQAFADTAKTGIIRIGESVIIDATPDTPIHDILDVVESCGLPTVMVEMVVGLGDTVKRSSLSEARVVVEHNNMTKAISALRRSGRFDQDIRYRWISEGAGLLEGRFQVENKGGPRARKQIVQAPQDVEGEEPEKPKMRKQIAVQEARGGSSLVRKARLNEQLDVGQDAEKTATAKSMKTAAENLKKAREAIFALTTADLIQASSMAKAAGMKRSAGVLDKAQTMGASFLDELQKIGGVLDKANETLKGENGGVGGDTVDQPVPVPGAPAPAPMNGNGVEPAPAPVEPAPVEPAPITPAVESVNAALAIIMETDIPDRIISGEDYRSLNEAIRGHCPQLDVRARIAIIERIKTAGSMPADAALRLTFSSRDHRMLAEVATFGSLTEGLVERTIGGRQTLASVSELTEAVNSLRRRGKATHALLADALENALTEKVGASA